MPSIKFTWPGHDFYGHSLLRWILKHKCRWFLLMALRDCLPLGGEESSWPDRQCLLFTIYPQYPVTSHDKRFVIAFSNTAALFEYRWPKTVSSGDTELVKQNNNFVGVIGSFQTLLLLVNSLSLKLSISRLQCL